jgi:phenylacetaldehyde dehydrogenase
VALVDHPGVDKVAFTGSTATGKSIVRACAATLKRVSLELGGKSPTVILPDADLSKAIPGASRSIFFNSGQVCAAGSRLFAHKKIFDEVVGGIAEEAKRLKVGPGLSPETEIGPLVSEEQFQRVTGYLAAGAKEGANVLVGGNSIGNRGYFVEPTILADTNRAMSVRQEEIFGPVLCAMSFDDEDLERIANEANDTTYGLAATIWTRDISAGHKLAKLLKAGSIRINGGGLDHAVPFGGYKQSGWGRENGKDGVELFTEVKAVSVNLS